MNRIRSKSDLKSAYQFLNVLDEILNGKKSRDGIKKMQIDTKRRIRSYYKWQDEQLEEIRFIGGDYDSYMELIKFPENIKSFEAAEDYFNNEYRLVAIPSQFDCTGQKFTSGHKICFRRGNFYCYHSVSLDV